MAQLSKFSVTFLLFYLTASLKAQKNFQDSIDNFHLDVSRLSPVPEIVGGTSIAKMSLNGKWKFSINANKKTSSIIVPGEWEMQGYKVNEGETALYTRLLNIPTGWKGKRIKLRFDGVSSHAVVKVNGKKIMEHEGGFVPFEGDITDVLNKDKNTLQVEVQALTVSDQLSALSQYAAHTVGGILRKVTLFALPEVNISSVIVKTTFDGEYKNAVLVLENNIADESGEAQKVELRLKLIDGAGKILKDSSLSIPVNANSNIAKSVSFYLQNPEKWNNEHPYLYTLITSLYSKRKLLQRNRQKVGFREVRVAGSRLLINGKPVKLHGVNRHEIYPLTGRTITPELSIKDAVLFRNANCNYIRTSHYPPSEEFLNAADSLGLFVESESALCWIKHPEATPIWKKWNYLDLKLLPLMVAANVEKMIAQRNHPSIIIWSLANESYWSPLWAKVQQIVKSIDTTRPTTFHDQYRGDYNNGGSKADISVYHYPTIDGPAMCDTVARPVLFGEYAHLSNYNRRELATDPGVRVSYGAPLVQIYDSIYHHTACLGGAIWSGIDDIFHLPDGRIVGYGPWGPIDGWRRTKPEYIGIKKAYSPVVITNGNKPVIEKKELLLKVENRYDFTNMQKVGITYKVNDQKNKKLIQNISPHDSGLIRIPVTESSRQVYIAFTDPRGFVVNEEKIVLKEDPVQPDNTITEVSVFENDASITVKQNNISYLISKLNGIIKSVKKNDKEILTQGPVFGVVPMNTEEGGKPSVASETYQNNIYPLKNYSLLPLFVDSISIDKSGIDIVICMNITFKEGKGKQWYQFSKNGNLTASYEIRYTGNDTFPRQYGMMMQLPKTYDKITWKRKGEFSIYPANDIGRNEGFAYLNSKHMEAIEEPLKKLFGSWKDDANDFGSNDFRSTKRYIYNAALSDFENDGIEIISDGTQSARSWLQDEQLQLLVADFNNNGAEPVYTTPHRNSRINIMNKTLKGKVVMMIK